MSHGRRVLSICSIRMEAQCNSFLQVRCPPTVSINSYMMSMVPSALHFILNCWPAFRATSEATIHRRPCRIHRPCFSLLCFSLSRLPISRATTFFQSPCLTSMVFTTWVHEHPAPASPTAAAGMAAGEDRTRNRCQWSTNQHKLASSAQANDALPPELHAHPRLPCCSHHVCCALQPVGMAAEPEGIR